MPINFINETVEIIADIKKADDYSGVEIIIINKIKKHLANRVKIDVIDRHLRRLLKYFEGQIKLTHCDTEYIKYMYSASIINILLETNYWHNWITELSSNSKGN